MIVREAWIYPTWEVEAKTHKKGLLQALYSTFNQARLFKHWFQVSSQLFFFFSFDLVFWFLCHVLYYSISSTIAKWNHVSLQLMTKILRGSKSTITKSASGAIRKPKPYVGGVLALTRIVYAALEEDELPEPWVISKGEKVGTRTVPGSRHSKSEKLAVSSNKATSKKSTRSTTHRAQSTKQMDAQGADPEELAEAIKLTQRN